MLRRTSVLRRTLLRVTGGVQTLLGMKGLLRHRDARLYIAGQVISLIGDTTRWLDLGIWVKLMTGSASAAGLVFLCTRSLTSRPLPAVNQLIAALEPWEYVVIGCCDISLSASPPMEGPWAARRRPSRRSTRG